MTSELKPCPDCKGTGMEDYAAEGLIDCSTCNGKGRAASYLDANPCMATDVENQECKNLAHKPDPLAGLVRYSVPDRYDKLMPDGEYVLHSQAVEIIAAKDAEINRLSQSSNQADQSLVDKYRDPQSGLFNFPTDVAKIVRRLEAAEAELATLKEINANLMGDDEDKPRYTTKRLKHEIEKAVEAKLAQYEAQHIAFYKCEGCDRVTDDPHEDMRKLKLAGHLSCCPDRKMLHYFSAPAADLKAENENLREVIENSGCPRPCNGRSDDTTVKECISYGECSCVYGSALKGESNV